VETMAGAETMAEVDTMAEAETATATAEPEGSQSAPASTPAGEQPARPRSGTKKNAKGRRSSVPSWDEIMLGSSRQRE
ncbi:MAG: hypothetical protein ACRDNS_12865, partial [Trebonia sp.]